MNGFEIAFGIVLVLVAVAIIVIVLLQQSRESGLSGVIAGGAETFFGKNKGRSIEAKLAKYTKILAVVFFVLVFIGGLVLAYTHA